MTEWFFRAGLVLAILILAILATTTVSWVRIDHFSVGLQFTCLAAAMAAMLIGLWWLRQPTVAPYRVQLPLSVACLAFAIQSFYPAARILTHETRREAGAELNQNLPPDTTVYLLPDPDAPLAVELIYLHETVKRIDSPAELPEERLELYVLAGAKPPILETRAWQEVSPLVPIRQEPVIHWDWLPKGGGLLRLERTFDGTDRGVGVARVYRGTLKTLPQAPLLPPLPPPSPTATP